MSGQNLTFEIIWLDVESADLSTPDFKIVGREEISRYNLDMAIAAASSRLAHQKGKAAEARGFVVRSRRES